MELLEEQLGNMLGTKEIANYLGIDPKTVRKHYKELGGVKLGRHYKFFERSIVDAVQKRTEVGGRSEKSEGKKTKAILDQERSDRVGNRNEQKVRKSLEEGDKYKIFG